MFRNLPNRIPEAFKKIWEGFHEVWVGLSYRGWILYKNWQSLARTHLPHVLAVVLAGLVAWRERREILGMICSLAWPNPFGLLVLLVTILTFLDAWWALRRNKLTTSPQEIRFQSGMKVLLDKLEELTEFQGARESVEKQFDDFVVLVLGVAARTFSVKSQVDAGLMLNIPGQNLLELRKWSRGARYDETLTISLPVDDEFRDSGPAGLAFKKLQLVYVPKKDRNKPRNAWPFRLVAETEKEFNFDYVPSEPRRCWKKAQEPDQEDFRSVICVPIEGLGVLNFSTKMRDPFIDRDFFMAECYASILRHAAKLTRGKKI